MSKTRLSPLLFGTTTADEPAGATLLLRATDAPLAPPQERVHPTKLVAHNSNSHILEYRLVFKANVVEGRLLPTYSSERRI